MKVGTDRCKANNAQSVKSFAKFLSGAAREAYTPKVERADRVLGLSQTASSGDDSNNPLGDMRRTAEGWVAL